ncbi:diacylglycerol/lipid kinase family protein [Nocardia sp. CA-129566]|uniref:diacylglycerol/lipid kinase family protein n=1 Tax=Nocardia sp. CA-129566 TaxID=3239976 RepID=UPI003D96511E
MSDSRRTVAVVYNSTAGMSRDGRPNRARDDIERILHDTNLTPLWMEVSESRSIDSCVREMTGSGVELVLVCGGDGTVSRFAGVLASCDIPMGIVPMGTGNMLAALLRLPFEASAAASGAISGPALSIDLIRCGEQVATFVTSIGIGAAIMRNVDRRRKARFGAYAYLVAFARQLTYRRDWFRIEIDGSPPVIRRGSGVLVGNLGALASGNRLAHSALDDGLLEVVVFDIVPRMAWLKRRSIENSNVTRTCEWHQGRAVIVTASRLHPIETDGDWIGEAQSIQAQVLPRHLSIRGALPPDAARHGSWPLRLARRCLSAWVPHLGMVRQIRKSRQGPSQ